MQQILVYSYVMAVGFVAAGLCASFAQLMTQRPLTFAVVPRPAVLAPAAVLTRVLAGPAIIMRNAIRGALLEGRPPVWLVASTLIAAIWSFFSGAVVIEVAIHVLA